jgi:hypothetical protein
MRMVVPISSGLWDNSMERRDVMSSQADCARIYGEVFLEE